MSLYAHETVQLLQQQTPDFNSPDLWLPNSPKPGFTIEFRDWCKNVCTRKPSATLVTWSSVSLKQCASISQNIIDDAVGQWRKWLYASVKADGHRFEYLLN